MSIPRKFDAAHVSQLAQRIEGLTTKIVDLKESAREAADALNKAEVELKNVQIELTRAVDGHVDRSTLSYIAQPVSIT